uniref:Uncharacterized protein n=1 Tax=Clytia hemisphaerica TaxID=252671 RepID=A0A7M5X1R5_9CNID|eukprot:TCONS_00026343-protein
MKTMVCHLFASCFIFSLAMVDAGRIFTFNQDLCALYSNINSINLQAVPAYATDREVKIAEICRIPYAACQQWSSPSDLGACCQHAKGFCRNQSTNNGPCAKYCDCWKDHCKHDK